MAQDFQVAPRVEVKRLVSTEAVEVERSAALTELLRKGLLIRATEKRLLELFAQGKLFGTVHTCLGEELSGPAVAAALEEGDLVFTNHRGHGHFIARTGMVGELLAEIMGKGTGVCAGRGGSQHLCTGNFFSNGIIGSIVPVAAGLACGCVLKESPAISVAFIGDGTLGQGVVYETFNIVSRWQLPLLVVLENNRYAQSTPQTQTLAGDIEARAAAFGIATARTSVWDPAELLEAAARAVRHVRETRSPFFLRVDCDRLAAHSKGDEIRNPAEIAAYHERDPIRLLAEGDPEGAARLGAEAEALVDEALAKAEAAPPGSIRPDDEDPLPDEPCSFRAAPPGSEERIAAVLREALGRNMERDGRIVLLGEDIEEPYGGSFKVTKGLSDRFPGRVRNTPISEAAICGLGTGLAMSGSIPVVEYMFGDFVMLAADQLVNSAAKFRFAYDNQVQIPLILRTPMGGRRGYGPTHSQSLEKHLLGIPGTLVLALNERCDPGLTYDTLFETVDRPTLVVENKLLYGASVSNKAPAGFAWEISDERFPSARLSPGCKPDLTVVCYGGMLPVAVAAAEALFQNEEIACEILCPQQLFPFNVRPVLDSLRQTGRLLVAEEGQGFAAFGSELIARVVELSASPLAAVRRVSAARHAIPSAGHLEKQTLPDANAIRQAARLLFGIR